VHADTGTGRGERRGSPASTPRPEPTVPVYSVWHEGDCKAICDTLKRARWHRRRFRGARIEITYRYGL